MSLLIFKNLTSVDVHFLVVYFDNLVFEYWELLNRKDSVTMAPKVAEESGELAE